VTTYHSHPQPTSDYATALERYAQLQAQDTSDLNTVCATRLLTHGHPTAWAVVLVHGYTNCPKQFALLGEQLHQRGHNVLIPRMPYHGLQDRLTPKLADLTGQQLAQLVDDTVDIARGLGEQVVFVGLSAGGVLAAWAAQQRADVARCVIISPSFFMASLPPIWNKFLTNLMLTLPNFFVWWDAKLKAETKLRHAYPRLSTRALGHIFDLGLAVQTAARRGTPRAQQIWMVINPSDPAVNNAVAEKLMTHWRQTANGKTHTYTYPREWHLIHDIIDPEQIEQQVERVYPPLIALIETGQTPA